MAKSNAKKPTEAELAILGVVWDKGPSTVRQVQEILVEQRGTGYTTMLKLMQIMFEKGLLSRDESGLAHIYRAAITRKRTQRQIVSRLVDQLFEGSAQQLALHALSTRKSTPEEISEIRRLLDDQEGKSK